MASESPNSFRDPYWSGLASKAEEKYGLTPGLLVSVLTNGERSNKNQVSEAGASTVFQIIPKTREQILKRDGIDAYLNDQNAADAAALVLKDGVNWARGRAKTPTEADALAAGYYHAGGDTANWGPKTQAYMNRVGVGLQSKKVDELSSGFASFMKANPAVPTASAAAPVAAEPAKDDLSAGFGQWLEQQPAPAAPVEEPGMLAQVADTVTGNLRKTATSDALPDWASMPELNQLSMASAKTGLGTMASNPEETVKIIQANFPGIQTRQDEKGNYLLKSSVDGKEYAIKPGFQPSDIPRALSIGAAFTPAGGARSIAGMAMAGGATQAAIEGTQAATGGTFNPGEVATAAVAGAAVPLVARAGGAMMDAGKAGLSRLRGVPEPIPAPAMAAREAAAAPAISPISASSTPAADQSAMRPGPMMWRNADTDIPVKFKNIEPKAGPDGRMYAKVEVDGRESFVPADELVAVPKVVPKAPLAADELAQTARKAAEGGMGSSRAAKILAGEAAPDAATVNAAKRLGIEEHLQPDHVTTNQAYRELAQAVKSIPGSETRSAEMAGLEKVGARAEKLIDDIGGTADLSTVSATVKKQMQDTQQQLEKEANKLYDRVRQEIPLKAEAPATNVLSFINKRAEELGGSANLTPMEKRLLAKLEPKSGSKLEQAVADPEQAGLLLGGRKPTAQRIEVVKQPTYALLDDMRKDVGAATRMTGPFKDADTGLAKKLYELITEDQAKVVGSHGATELFNAARASIVTRKALEDDLVSLFGKALDGSIVGDLSGAVRAVSQGDTARLVRLLKSVPDNQRQMVMASGLSSAFRTAGTKGPISFTQYAKWYEGLLRNKQAYTAVMSNLPGTARKQLSDLYRVSQGISAASRERITTGRIQAFTEQFKGADNLVDRIYSVARKSAVGATAGTAAGAVFGPGVGAAVASALTGGAKPQAIKAADALLSSPEFAQMVKGGGREAVKAKRLANSAPFKRFAAAVGKDSDLSNRERWILQVIQGQNQTQD